MHHTVVALVLKHDLIAVLEIEAKGLDHIAACDTSLFTSGVQQEWLGTGVARHYLLGNIYTIVAVGSCRWCT